MARSARVCLEAHGIFDTMSNTRCLTTLETGVFWTVTDRDVPDTLAGTYAYTAWYRLKRLGA